MFLGLPVDSHMSLQHFVLILNTIVLIGILVAVELVYSEKPAASRKQLRYFYPLVIVLAGLLLYAVYTQMGQGA
jgi:hypothetical protein